MTSNAKRKGNAILLIVAFVLPVILAKLALELNWFNKGATNRGTLIQPTIDVSGLLSELPPKWRLVYAMPQQCDQACKNTLYSMQQVWTALGRETHRVEATVLLTPESENAQLLSELGTDLNPLKVTDAQIAHVLRDTGLDGIYVVDTQFNAMLRYPIFSDKDEAVMASRDILSDLKKLLKLSRIG